MKKTKTKDKMHIGIINIMPKTATYHDELLAALGSASDQAEFYWIRLQTKSYADEDLQFMDGLYQEYSLLSDSVTLDALIVTGAPVELLDFTAVNYWPELKQILQHAMAANLCTLGICWGALAIAQLLDIGKTELDQKVFGVFSELSPVTKTADNHSFHSPQIMPFSIQAKFSVHDVARQLAADRVFCLAALPPLGSTLLCSTDQRHLLCQGHPECGPYRLLDEWRRDLTRMPGLLPPTGLNLDAPIATWREEADAMFSSWLATVQRLSLQHRSGASLPLATAEPIHATQNIQRVTP